jgi:hypothetical protein
MSGLFCAIAESSMCLYLKNQRVVEQTDLQMLRPPRLAGVLSEQLGLLKEDVY